MIEGGVALRGYEDDDHAGRLRFKVAMIGQHLTNFRTWGAMWSIGVWEVMFLVWFGSVVQHFGLVALLVLIPVLN